MEGEIDPNFPLDYIEFQISPDQNRYEVCICIDNFIESVSSGPLEPLLLHSPKIRALHAKGCNATYQLVAPDDLNAASRWFTKSTLVRFLDIIGSSEALNATVGMRNEISQLEEARRFHLSLYAKGPQNHLDSEDEGSSTGDASSLKAGINSASPDDSKNELLRAMDLRLTALRGELAAAFGQAAITVCTTKEVDDLEKFSSHFGATDLRNTLSKVIESSREKCTVDKQSSSKNAFGIGRISNKEENVNTPIQSHSEVPVKYGVSPAKVAEIERQSSSESCESSYSSEEEQPSMERSRSLIRSASPRRSASPMRRIQIGRSGSRRSTPLTIKSLNYFPRERLASHRDAAVHSSDEEASEQPSKRSETNVRRMSVQDAINLFESKQRDQSMDIQKTKSLFNATMGANKSVLRRWSAGTFESSNGCPEDTVSDNSIALNPDNLVDETANSSPESRPEYGCPAESCPANAVEVDSRPDSSEQSTDNLVSTLETVVSNEIVGTSEKLNASAEWSRQKEAELNQLLMKMMETKPVKYQKGTPEINKIQNPSAEQRGGFYDHYKEKRNEKLRRETAGKRSEKEKQFQAMQQILDERKAQMVSSNTSDGGKKRTMKTQKTQKTLSQPGNTKKDIAKPSVLRKASPKASSLPATRKSWPSTPSTRPTGISTAKTPPGTTSARITPTRRKSQPPAVAPKSSLKVDRTEPQLKSLKATQKTSKAVRNVNEKKQQPLRKTATPTNAKVQTNSAEPKPGKPSLYNKVTKKGSVVPLESKTFLRKGSGIGSGVSPALRTKVSSQPEESGDLNQAEENERISSSSDPVIQLPEAVLATSKAHIDEESENQEKRQEECAGPEIPNQGPLEEVSFQNTPDSKLDTEAAEEVTIPPTAWVEIEEQEDQALPSTNGISQIESSPSVAPMGMPSPRVRHSLSQMLLEESSEPDVIEWGNAENPRSMVYQRDAPKGLKRLLKFARKSKTDANSTGWSSPSVFSEGEDDTEESKSISKRSTENLLKKATLHGKNHGHQKTSLQEKDLPANGFFAQANASKSTAQSLSEKLHDGQIAASVTTTKATRSFFSLSAFKGGKQNEIKFR